MDWNRLQLSTMGSNQIRCLSNRGIQQPNYHQGKRLPNKERMKNNMKTYEGKACFMFVYRLATLIIMHQLSFYNNYHHVATTFFYKIEKKTSVPTNFMQLLPTVYKPSITTTYHLQHLQTLCSYCLLFATTLYPLQTSNTITTFLLLPSNGNYLLVASLPSYSSTNNTFIIK